MNHDESADRIASRLRLGPGGAAVPSPPGWSRVLPRGGPEAVQSGAGFGRSQNLFLWCYCSIAYPALPDRSGIRGRKQGLCGF